MSENQTNWSGNYLYSAERWHFPETVAQVQEVVVSCTKLRAVGTRHSFNGIADSTHDMVSLERCDRVLTLDRAQRTVTVEAGIRYGQLARYLHAEGYALHNLASLPHISLAGACATATHGSGVGNGNLATAVAAMEIVTANGQCVELSRAEDGEKFLGAVVGLGGLGVVTKLTLDIVPTFSLRQDVYENLPMEELADHFDDIVGSAYSVSLFTDWRSERFNQWWLKSIVPESETLPESPAGKVSPSAQGGRSNVSLPAKERYGATLATAPRHPLAGLSAESCTEQGGAPGPWHERLPHFRMDFTPSAGEELQSEYFVPHRLGCEALRALAGLRERIAPLLQVSEIRTVAADNLWMSPCYRQASVALHFTWLKDWPGVKALLPQIEEALAPFDARPHWGKLFTMPPDRLQALYPKLPEFRRLLHAFDPDGKFRNAYLETLY